MKTRLAGLLALTLGTFVANSHADGIPGQGTWETTLLARDLDGNTANGPEAFYDVDLNITWLRSSSINSMDLAPAKTWAEQDRFGLSGWRLPTTVDTGEVGCNFSTGGTDCGYNPDSSVATGSEMAHLFFVSLGNKAPYFPGTYISQPGSGLTNSGNFQNLQAKVYWTGTAYMSTNTAWHFDMESSYQGYGGLSGGYFALAVLDGDVAAVPEPQTCALMLAGLGLIAGIARRRRSQRQA